MNIHMPYIVGYVDNISQAFQYFTGADCMEKFIRHLFTYREKMSDEPFHTISPCEILKCLTDIIHKPDNVWGVDFHVLGA